MGGEGGQYEKIQNTVGQHPENSILCGCNRFFFKLEGGVLNKYNNWAFYGQAEVGKLQKSLFDELPGGGWTTI